MDSGDGALRLGISGDSGMPGTPSIGVSGDGTAGPTEAVTAALKVGQSEEGAPPLTLLAEWALWGKDERDTGYHVMRCSKGDLDAEVFSNIIRRYQSGVKPSLPQYTVCWRPGLQRRPEYLAVEIHEVIEPGSPSSGDRRRNVGGRVVEYVRMFCFRYEDVAGFGASYTELVKAVADIPLLEGQTERIEVELPPGFEPGIPADSERQLAEDVAVTLLTGSPVCVLDADGVPAERRLAFIDLVMSLLPFGLRATLSASTSASTTTQDLRLRLYFSNAPREDGGRTSHVSWSRPGFARIAQGHEAARLYKEWLRDAGPGAIGGLTGLTAPIRFTEAEELQMLTRLPNDKSVAETLAELSGKLRAVDQPAVSAIVKRLKRYLASPQDPADRAVYRSLMLKYGLFGEHSGIHGNVRSSVYRTLLSLGFEMPLSYAAYCEIEDSVGGQPSWTLRQVLLGNKLNVLACVRAALAGPGIEYDQLRDAVVVPDIRAVRLLGILEREMDSIRPRHRADLIDFTLWYLSSPESLSDQWRAAEGPRTDLFDRGYLSGLLARAFPDDQAKQRDRLIEILKYVHGERLGPRQIRDIFEAPRLYPGPAVEAAVKRLTLPQHRRFVEKQAAAARLRHAGHAEEVTKLLQPSNWSLSWPAGRSRPRPVTEPDRGKLVFAFAVGLAIIAGIVVLALLVAV
jgi:hypothetical protein